METGVKIIEGSCRGCVNCIKSCPTEALRVAPSSPTTGARGS